ncbi:DUF1028 domain-containing protein [Roseibium marinum]|uniref:Putative Ntn-hydrolase superfamily protein n=1 Tax=Roseibium marinum TaxID=281252 RepID=A0A2S3UTQ1_9HYPH|nr:DUF1028 domain-containing protein [Roseibium marinum]POF30940.1 putative Ntn-hydrolase superfamily protein [Roseibium marinum]
MTYSIAAQCPISGAFGIAITSSSICVPSRCAWIGPLGAVVTQNVTDPGLGPAGQALLRQGLQAGSVLDILRDGTPQPEWRQIGVVDRYGKTAFHSGAEALGTAAVAQGNAALAMGNLLSNEDVPQAMIRAFSATGPGMPLAERLLGALEAGLDAGGETGDEHSAGLHVANRFDWPVVDLRIDWSDTPIAGLRALWTRYKPQQAEYELRARNPSDAPTF